MRDGVLRRCGLVSVIFRVTDATPSLRFVLEIAGKPRPAEVEAGKDNFKPNESPLVVNLR